MATLFVLVILALSSWALVALFRRMRREQAGVFQWILFALFVVCGAALGVWCAFYCEYSISAHYRIVSFPIPAGFFHFEDGQWVDFPVPEFQAYATLFANVVAMIAIATLPLWLVLARQRSHASVTQTPN